MNFFTGPTYNKIKYDLIRLMLSILSVLIIIPSYSQVKFGVNAGMNLSTIDSKSAASNPQPIVRYQLGIFSELALSDKLSIESNLSYAVKGWVFASPIPVLTGRNGHINLHYLNLQILGKYQIFKKSSILCGGELGYLFHTRRYPYNPIFDDLYEKNDIGLIVGAEYQLSKIIRINLKYIHGLSYLLKQEIVDFDGNFLREKKDSQNRGVQFGLGVVLF